MERALDNFLAIKFAAFVTRPSVKNDPFDILLMVDENKNVVQGNKKHIDTITEEWTFSRNIKSKENFWIVENIENLSND